VQTCLPILHLDEADINNLSVHSNLLFFAATFARIAASDMEIKQGMWLCAQSPQFYCLFYGSFDI